MRIGIAVPTLGFQGGVERYAHDLARDLAARGHALVLLHGRPQGRDPARFAEPFGAALPLADARAARLDVAFVQRAADGGELAPFGDVPLLVASHDHDLTCMRSHRYLPLGRAPCHRSPGAGCVLRGCAVVRDRRPGRALPVMLASPFALRARLRALAERAVLVACSRYIADQLVAAGAPAERVRAVHPVPPETGAPLVPRPAALRMLIVGQLLRGKGFDLAVEALAHLPRGVVLEVVGDGPSRGELVELASRLAPGRVRFHGYIRPEALDPLYDTARVVLVPSRWPEPFGMVGIEAMRRGRPVAAARHGGIPEWLAEGEGGALFEPGDPVDLARAARRLLDDEGAGERAEFASRRFRRADFVARIEALLEEAAASRGRRAGKAA